MRSGLKSERGQVAILFALVFTFMFVLFAFVVDFAQLINNKMNLQIAADMAAYTGAAWQARTLNKIGQVNYHLRQDFKELAMRVNVTHARHNREFPKGTGFIRGGNAQSSHQPFVCQQAHGNRSLAGVQFQPITNLCANADPRSGGLPPIVVPPVIAGFDPFQVALNQQLTRIRDIADTQCRAGATDNRALVNHLADIYIKRSQFHASQVRELETFLNEDLNSEQPNENSRHPLLKTVYETVRRNLSSSNRQDIKIEILRPNGNRYVELDEYSTNAKLFYYNFSTAGSGCVAVPQKTDFIPIVAGFEKNQEIMTYFAIKVSATPRLLFMPAKWIESGFPKLEAFAAAKPFGSRIGPKKTTDFLVPTPGRPNNTNPMVNFSFIPNDNLGILNTKRLALFDRFHPYNSAGFPDGNQISGWPEPDRANNRSALQLARAPTIFDAIFYTVFPDPGSNINNDYEEADQALALFPDFLEASAPDNTLINIPAMGGNTPYYRNLSSQNKGPGWIQVNAPPDGGTDYGSYAREQLGSHSTTGVTGFEFVSENPNDFGFATKEQIHSGWTPRGEKGRIGYSVKFVPFDGLMRFLEVEGTSGGKVPLANRPTGDPNLNKILH